MLLSDVEIKKHMKWGSVVIDPFVPQRLNNASYDLSLGPWVARYKEVDGVIRPHESSDLFELFDSSDDGGYVLQPGERVLGHTREAAGGTVGKRPKDWRQGERGDGDILLAVNSNIHATSTAQRIGISVCMDAGWGDVGFVYPWTLEITCHAPYPVFLPVGAIICQITFEQVSVPERMYTQQGSYMSEEPWRPEMMLPKTMKVASAPNAESKRL